MGDSGSRTKKYFGIAAAFAANFIFGFSFLFSKSAIKEAHPLIVLAFRFTAAFITMTLLRILHIVKINYKGKKLRRLLAMSIAQPLLYFVFELYGLSLTSSALSGIVIALVPVGVILLSAGFLKEKPTNMQCICTAISVAGVSAISLFSGDNGANRAIGVLLLILAVVSASVFNILSRGISGEFSAVERTYFMFLVGCIGFNVMAFAVLRGQYIPQFSQALKSSEVWISIGYLAVVSSVAAFLLYHYSTTVITAVEASSFSNITTVVSVLAGVLILKEPFSFLQLLLCIPIIFGVWGVNRFGN